MGGKPRISPQIIYLVQWGNRKPGWGRGSQVPGPGSVSWSWKQPAYVLWKRSRSAPQGWPPSPLAVGAAMRPESANGDFVGRATGTGLASGENREGSSCQWGQITLQASLASGSEGGDAPRCAPHSVVAGDNPRTGIGRQRTRRSGRGPQKPRLPASCMQMLLAQ